MRKLWGILLVLFPALLFAEENISFNPPPGDMSVVFLGNIFGIVEGVLHGTGSQILGNMFAVFNTAVMALGSIVIMYTLIVGTMNTAHEGQFLGQKWASIWVPMRSVAGMGLLVPQASGYCIMQIFVMWVVVQGVGAADKVWSVALDYLNRGGVIVQAQMTPKVSLTADNGDIATGAAIILEGQVCMRGLEIILNALRDELVQVANEKKSGVCYKPTAAYADFCTKPIPDLISSVNAVRYQQDQNKLVKDNYEAKVAAAIKNAKEQGLPLPASSSPPPDPSSYTLPMPYITEGPYSILTGVCGKIVWNNFSEGNAAFANLAKYGSSNTSTTISVSAGDLKTAELSRAIAIQQMYVDLSTVASAMVFNNPFLSKHPSNPNDPNADKPAVPFVAQQQYGVPQTEDGLTCTGNSASCVSWGVDPTIPHSGGALFNGTEFQGAIMDYNAIMLPTLRLLQEAAAGTAAQGARDFILGAEQHGWILAGSYFFDLARLNALGESMGDSVDQKTGLNESVSATSQLSDIIKSQIGQCQSSPADCACGASSHIQLCQWIYQYPQYLDNLKSALNAENLTGANPSPVPFTFNNSTTPVYSGVAGSTISGFVNNSMVVRIAGQPGMQPPQFAMKFNMSVPPTTMTMPNISFPCGWVFFIGCIGRALADLFYNLLIRNIFDIFLHLIQGAVNNLFMAIVSVPLVGLSQIFLQAVSIIQQPAVNPVIALANMGVTYINFASELWISLTILTVGTMMIPVFGVAILPIIMCMMPLIAAWLGMMVLIGFLTAYYIPFLPYMIFTFASIGWLMAVIEAMVAAPIVALGVCFPEGHEAFGKSEAAFMILLNVFLRPTMMVIGFIAGIILSYVAVWVINAGFSNALVFMQGNPNGPTYSYGSSTGAEAALKGAGDPAWSGLKDMGSAIGEEGKALNPFQKGGGAIAQTFSDATSSNSGSYNYDNSSRATATEAGQMNLKTGYTGWAGVFGFFMAILLYTMMYITVVQEAFNLITALPDKVLRWIGGQAESIGGETGKWTEQTKGQMDKSGEKTNTAMSQIGGKLQGQAAGLGAKAGGESGGGAENVEASQTPPPTQLPPL